MDAVQETLPMLLFSLMDVFALMLIIFAFLPPNHKPKELILLLSDGTRWEMVVVLKNSSPEKMSFVIRLL